MLVLAGTTEAAALALELHGRAGVEVTSSFAGRTTRPAAVPGAVRVGGFGGVDGLASALVDGGFDLLVDATHPFAARMPHAAAAAAERAGVPRLRLLRPGWTAVKGDRWLAAQDLADAARLVGGLGVERVLLTTGRLELSPFAAVAGVHFVVRSIERPQPMPLPDATIVLARGPFAEADEVALLAHHRIQAVVAKDSGGSATAAKLTAARAAGIPVVLVRRPPQPVGPTVATVSAAAAWVRARS